MAIFRCGFFSTCLNTEAKVVVTLPDPLVVTEEEDFMEKRFDPDKKLKVVYLLHGVFANEESWLRYTAVERYARERQIALVMPYGENSFYQNIHAGRLYYDYISRELPLFIKSTFNSISREPEDTFIAGLSMGGYGALLTALHNPENFNSVASFSGALDVETMYREKPIAGFPFDKVFGPDDSKVKGGESDIFALLERKIKAGEKLPKIYQSCGTEDGLIEMNRKFRDLAEKLGADLTYSEGPGTHSWDLWDREIQKAFDFFNLPVIS